ncbi:MAG: extracellular solute-binding protein [Clostridia bacterium]|nr:extracellular solute-binding protein [Clostridia bacterium]
MKFKKLACVAASVLMVGAIAVPMAACGGNGDGLDSDGNVKKITMWCGGSEWTGQNYVNLDNFIKEYNKVKPDGFEVKLEHKPDLETSFQSVLTSSKLPDMMIWDRFNTATNGIKDYLYPVNDLVEADNIDTTAFYAPAMEEMTYENKIYGLPIDVDIWGTYVNMKYVKEYDDAHPGATISQLLTANWTWDDLLTVAKALKTTSVNTAYSGGDQYEHLFKYYVSTGHGEEYLVPVEGDTTGRKFQTNFDNQRTRDILNFFKEVTNAGVSGKQEADSFIGGVCAMMNKPLYHNNQIKTSKVTDYKFLPQPRQNSEDGVNGGMVGGYGIAYPSPKGKYHNKAWEARHQAAWKFTKWLCYNKDNMLKWTKDIGSLPALSEALNADECVAGNQVLADARTYATAKKTDGSFVYTIRPQVPNYLTLQTDVVNAYVRLFLEGNDSLETCISNLKTNGNTKLLFGLGS